MRLNGNRNQYSLSRETRSLYEVLYYTTALGG